MSAGAFDFDNIPLLGIDVGFSKTRATTGIAWSAGGDFGAGRTHSDWDRRKVHIPADTMFSVIAIDGPLLPLGTDEDRNRVCEHLFIRGAFQKRCKPGLSNHGYGRALRRAAADTAEQVLHLAERNEKHARAVRAGTHIVEAFPNAFLGVLLPEARFALPSAGKRKKFDWLYDHAIDSGVLQNVFHSIGWTNRALIEQVLTETDHERRAAWICLLTAACVAASESNVVGDERGGWFWLPPERLWAEWALAALECNRAELA